VTATYLGDSQDATSTSQIVYVTLIAATQTSLAVSPNPVPANSAATLVAVVKESYASAIPTGTVAFWQGGYYIGTVAVDHTGTAVLHASDAGLSPRTYPVTAKYSGDATNAASNSPAVNVVVQ
jgi:hypothetical protein